MTAHDEQRLAEHSFTLVLSGDLESDVMMDALFEAGCDDATFGTVDGVGYADFIRAASSFAGALHSAIAAVESVPGTRVLRIEPDDLVTMNEIAERLDRSRESVRLLIKGARGPGGFPAPVSHLKARSRLWRWSEVSAWADQGLEPLDRHTASVVAAINAALALRESSTRLTSTEHEWVSSLIQAA